MKVPMPRRRGVLRYRKAESDSGLPELLPSYLGLDSEVPGTCQVPGTWGTWETI